MVLAKCCSQLDEVATYLRNKHSVPIKIIWRKLNEDTNGQVSFIGRKIILDPDKATMTTLCHEVGHLKEHLTLRIVFILMSLGLPGIAFYAMFPSIAIILYAIYAIAHRFVFREILQTLHKTIYDFGYDEFNRVHTDVCSKCNQKTCEKEVPARAPKEEK